MASCFKDLYDYEIIWKSKKCGTVMLKNTFHGNKNRSDGLYKQCKICRKKYYNESLVKIKKYYLDKGDRIKD